MGLYRWLHFVPCDSPLPSGTSEPGYIRSFNDGSKKCKKTSRNMQGFRRLSLGTGTSSILKHTWLNLKSRSKEIYPDSFVGESSLLQGKKRDESGLPKNTQSFMQVVYLLNDSVLNLDKNFKSLCP